MTTLVAVSQSSTTLWYLTRATGLVALVLLTATVVIGVVASVGWTTERWPRFLSQSVHRNLSLLCVGLVAVHVVTTIADGFVPITVADVFIPFHSPYRPVWVGLGAATFDLLLAVVLTSAVRRHIGYRSWRFVHWLAYLSWPIALFHGLGSGTDTPLPVILAVDALCGVAVVGVVAWRLVTGRTFTVGWRIGAALATMVVVVAAIGFAAVGPLRPNWSHRSGTSAALLSQIAASFAPKTAGATGTTAPSGVGSTVPPLAASSVPALPFDVRVSGTESASGPDASGNVQVTLSMHLGNGSSTPFTITLTGTAAGDGGVAMSSGSVTLGPYSGIVTALAGGTVSAVIEAPAAIQLTAHLNVDQASGLLSGRLSGVSGSSGSGAGGTYGGGSDR